ncbi:phospholipase/carboxylesterase [Roseibium hamelinense]|uniref:Phospholipase/carboxylesterase n=1 Tax=Roseibium hamelinense TaxID=150831 RepID=A0A562SIH0_9HYPH|nr:alpha/beta fold hydrolase [Roseibium hamelinense]MTI42478.1 alpha/beta hydrolase [Roseibium hamelinense]TWI80724.1 phospholipase/carboxylesterase [Roseibium hamelinense]
MALVTLNGPSFGPQSGSSPKQLVVILHGYGADGRDLIDLGRAWTAVLPDAIFIAPDAPEPLPFDGFGGRQWFALADRDIREYRLGVESAAPALHRFLDSQLQLQNLNNKDLVLVGFSQGAMMALYTGLTRMSPPAGILAYSGVFAGPGSVSKPAPPIKIIHGAEDDVVSPDFLQAAEQQLVDMGVAVETHLLHGLGHGIDERGMVLGGRFLEALFC